MVHTNHCTSVGMGFACLACVCLFSFLLECWKLLRGEDWILSLVFLVSLTFPNTYLSFLLFKNLVLVIEKMKCQIPLSVRSKQSEAFGEHR